MNLKLVNEMKEDLQGLEYHVRLFILHLENLYQSH